MKMGVVLTQRLERSGHLLSSFCGETSFYFLEIKYMNLLSRVKRSHEYSV